MDFGIGYFPTHDAMGPAALARMIEDRGQESLFVAEHTHTPASRESRYPGGGELPRKYNHTYDPFVALTAAATVTTRLRVGTGICLVNQRDPITTAKLVASLDHLSGGRFEFGVGAGWNREEMRNHGTDPRTRMRLVTERVEAMQEIWTHEVASYHGESSTSTTCGSGPSRCSDRTRRCSSAAPARPCWTGFSPSATRGSPTGARSRRTPRTGSRSSAPTRSARST
ncbi:MAG TPA: TIGR03619 family F420-dependent LLM class oxidoreductase [Solirubrobacteraceae bacterium]|nr:TIGR03619 family F420-dependent LLM class oxidoreductase [Solirubrobacteraceae bacterium]